MLPVTVGYGETTVPEVLNLTFYMVEDENIITSFFGDGIRKVFCRRHGTFRPSVIGKSSKSPAREVQDPTSRPMLEGDNSGRGGVLQVEGLLYWDLR